MTKSAPVCRCSHKAKARMPGPRRRIFALWMMSAVVGISNPAHTGSGDEGECTAYFDMLDDPKRVFLPEDLEPCSQTMKNSILRNARDDMEGQLDALKNLSHLAS